MRRGTSIALASFLIVLTAGAIIKAPEYLASHIEARITQRASSLGLEASIKEITTGFSPEVSVRSLTLTPSDSQAFALSIEAITLRAEVALFERRISAENVSLEDIQIKITDLESFLYWVQNLKAERKNISKPKAGRAGLFRVDLFPLPSVSIENLSIVAPGGVAQSCEGSLEDRGLTINAAIVQGKIACAFTVGARSGNLELQADFNPEELSPKIEARFAPPVEFSIGEQTVRVGGVRRQTNGETEMTAVQFVTPSLIAEASSIEFEPKPGISLPAMVKPLFDSKQPFAQALKNLAALNMEDVILYGPGDGNLSGRIRATLEGMLPSLLRSFPVALAEDEESVQGKKKNRKDSAIHRVTLEAFESLQGKLNTALTIPKHLNEAVPIDHIRIRRARLVDRAKGEKGKDVLHHINAELKKEGPMLNAKIAFRTPATGADRNVITIRADATAPALHAETTLRRVPLTPYAAFLPSWIRAEKGGSIHNVRLLFAADGDTRRARVEGELGMENVSLIAPAVSAAPIRFENLMVAADADFDSKQGFLNINNASAWLGPTFLSWAAEITNIPENPKISLKGSIEDVDANQAFQAIPSALVSTIRDARFKGTVGADLEIQFKTLNLDALKLRFTPRGKDFAILSLGEKVQLQTLFEPFVHRITTPSGPMSILVGAGSENFIPFESIPRYLQLAITTTEDATFFKHEGFAGFAIRRSIIQDLEKGAFVRGASTISQQTVKNLFLSHEKTIARKVQEAIITHAMEQTLSKEQILEIYFNIIEWGPDIFGLGQAARYYFDKPANELGLTDCLFLVSLIPAPRIYVREFESGKISANWKRRLTNYARKMLERKKISAAEFEMGKPYDPIFRGRDIIDALPPATPAQVP